MTDVLTDPKCLEHRSPAGFPEVPDRLRRVLEGCLDAGREPEEVGSHPEAEACVGGIHDPAYVERFRRAVERGDGLLDSADNPLSPKTWEAAWSAVSVTLHAADRVAAGKRAFAAVRPPGHHAEHGLAMGFCFFNNAAVAAEHFRRTHGLDRVAIYDFDVHHGNGTQHIFEERGDVLYASTHQYPFYPGTGAASETGRGAGEGATVNAPLPAGTDPQAFLDAVDEEILPALRDFRPEAIIASAGFDAWKGDPLGGFRLELETFTAVGRRLADVAARVCEGRLLSVLEGGYDLARLGELATSYLDGTER